MWRRDPSYLQTVREVCPVDTGSPSLDQVQDVLGRVQSSLKSWAYTNFGSVRREVSRLQRELEKVRGGSIGAGPSQKEKRIMSQISEMLAREECMEKQRLRLDWLKNGDRNTAFCQAKERERARGNRIKSLRTRDGSVVFKQEELEVVAAEFYKDLFAAQGDLDPRAVLEHVPWKVNDSMNESLTKPYTADEVRRAVFMMGANKAPGPDGFIAGFFQVHWELVGTQITEAVLNNLNGGVLPEDINKTTIVLIPKCKNAQDIKQYRPISLCNVLYKICSKVLANRLRCFLDEIIAEEQVPSCRDGSLQIMHWLHMNAPTI